MQVLMTISKQSQDGVPSRLCLETVIRNVFVLVFKYVQCIDRLWVIVSYVPYVYQEHIRYIRNNDPQSAYALHILKNQHE